MRREPQRVRESLEPAFPDSIVDLMLPHYAALKVAEQFRVLEAIAPGRIDLGVGRAPGPTGSPRMRSIRTRTRDEFPRQVHRAAGVGVRRAAGRGPSVRRDQGASDAGRRARNVDPRQLGLRRAARRAFRPAVRVRVFLQRRPRRRGGADLVSAQLPAQRAASAAAGHDLRLGRSPRIPKPRRGGCCRHASSGASGSSRASAGRS